MFQSASETPPAQFLTNDRLAGHAGGRSEASLIGGPVLFGLKVIDGPSRDPARQPPKYCTYMGCRWSEVQILSPRPELNPHSHWLCVFSFASIC